MGIGSPLISVTPAFGDYDGDGFVDMISSERRLYHNRGNENHWLRVQLVGTRSNRTGIGARLVATSGDLIQTREILGGNGFTQDDVFAHFELGMRTMVDRLEVRWPSGQSDVLEQIAADQTVRVIEGQSEHEVVVPTVWEDPSPESLVVGAATNLRVAVRPALFERNAQIERVTADLSSIGGSTEGPLHRLEDGVYGLETSVNAPSNGFKPIVIDIEQKTSLGSHWIALSRTLSVLPPGDVVMFAELESHNWSVGGESRIVRITSDSSADPSFSPDGTQILFASDRSGNSEIYRMDANGQHVVQLTDDPGTDQNPSFSPDGTQIVLCSNRHGNFEIYRMDADGKNVTRITNNPADDAFASFSPDGTRIVFSTQRDGDFEIYLMDADGENVTRLTSNMDADLFASFSPEGTQIAFTSDRTGDPDIWVMDLTGDNLTNLTGDATIDLLPSFSPDSTRIVFLALRDLVPDVHVLALRETTGTVVLDQRESNTVYEGDTALKLQASAAWEVLYTPNPPLEALGFESIRFAFHPGDVTASPQDMLQVSIVSGTVRTPSHRVDVDLDIKE